MENQNLTDDQVLEWAERIKHKRLNEARYKSFQNQDEVMIRWQNVGSKIGESYSSVTVSREDVDELVKHKLKIKVRTEDDT